VRIPTNVNLLIEEVRLPQMDPLAAGRPVTIITDLSPNLPVIKVDRDRIRQTLINLVHNAIKFNNPGGKIVISTKYDVEFVTVSVSDTAWAFPKRIYRIFSNASIKQIKPGHVGGSGLGLAIANIRSRLMVAIFRLKVKKARVPL